MFDEPEKQIKAMREMGEIEGVVPFKRIRFSNVKFNLARFF